MDELHSAEHEICRMLILMIVYAMTGNSDTDPSILLLLPTWLVLLALPHRVRSVRCTEHSIRPPTPWHTHSSDRSTENLREIKKTKDSDFISYCFSSPPLSYVRICFPKNDKASKSQSQFQSLFKSPRLRAQVGCKITENRSQNDFITRLIPGSKRTLNNGA